MAQIKLELPLYWIIRSLNFIFLNLSKGKFCWNYGYLYPRYATVSSDVHWRLLKVQHLIDSNWTASAYSAWVGFHYIGCHRAGILVIQYCNYVMQIWDNNYSKMLYVPCMISMTYHLDNSCYKIMVFLYFSVLYL